MYGASTKRTHAVKKMGFPMGVARNPFKKVKIQKATADAHKKLKPLHYKIVMHDHLGDGMSLAPIVVDAGHAPDDIELLIERATIGDGSRARDLLVEKLIRTLLNEESDTSLKARLVSAAGRLQ